MQSSTRILLLRHAETAAPELFHGAESDVALGDRGRIQAQKAARAIARLDPTAIYSSSLRRARETADPIAEATGLEVHVVPEIHERRMGNLSGRIQQEVRQIYESTRIRWEGGDLDATHDGAESYAMLRDRVMPAFINLAERHEGETIIVVSHGVVIRVLLTMLLPELGPADFGRVGIDFVAVNDLRRSGRVFTASNLNAPAETLA